MAGLYFNYSLDEFYQLTPVQFYLMLKYKQKQRMDDFNTLASEFRLNNFYTIKSAFGDTKNIKKPTDLYKLSSDQEEKKKKSGGVVLTKEDIDFISKLYPNVKTNLN